MDFIGKQLLRTEDARFLNGCGNYVDDIKVPDQAYAAFLRSPYASATITHIDTEQALSLEGVITVLTGKDWENSGGGDTSILWDVSSHDGTPMKTVPRPVLVSDTCKHVGDTLAMVVANSPNQAQNALEAINVSWTPRTCITQTAKAIEANAPLVHDDLQTNVSYDWRTGNLNDVQKIIKSASHVEKLELINNRVIPSPIEPRAVIGSYDRSSGRYTLWSTTQNPHLVRGWLANDTLKEDEQNLRVIAPDVGGGFGQKTYHYPEEPCVLWASKLIGRPVRWTSSRSEGMSVDTHARDHVTKCEIAFDNNNYITALYVDTIANLGAYQSQFGAAIPTMFYSSVLSGLYTIPNIYCRVRGVYTNTVSVDAYRGAGAPEGSYLLERLIDNSARALKINSLDLRELNLISKRKMPYKSATGTTYDVGDFPAALSRAKRIANFDGLVARQTECRKNGKLMGIGVASFIRSGGAGPSRLAAQLGSRMGLWDVANVRIHPTAKISVFCGSHSHGQSHATTYAQIVADRFGCAIADIDVIEGDTDRIPYGLGTWASRSITVVGTAITLASDRIIKKGANLAAHLMECDFNDITFSDGTYNVKGTDRNIHFSEIAKQSYYGANYPEDFELGLEETAFYDPDDFNYPYGVHVAVVNIDPDTGFITLDDYIAVNDVGRVINPMVVDGQCHGGIAQGTGQALMELATYGPDSGQLISGSLMDYAVPRARDLPSFTIDRLETITDTNPLGVKGAGELDTSGPPAAIANAVIDAVCHLGIKHIDLPLTPLKVWEAINLHSYPST